MKKNLLILTLISLIFSISLFAQDWDQIIKIVALDRAAGDLFGRSVSISGDYAIVGAYDEDEDAAGGTYLSAAGSAYIFYNNSGTWEQMQKIVASDRRAADNFGYSVSISDDYAIVGAYNEDEDSGGGNTLNAAGSAYIFYNNAGVWEQVNKIVASDRESADEFGKSVSISGDYAIVGAHNEDEDAGGGNTLIAAGSSYIFYNNAGTWVQVNKIVASDRESADEFGTSVSISGDYAIVGAPFENEDASGGNSISNSGSAYVFYNNSGTWEQVDKIVASDRASSDYFGFSVSISGDYAIIGAYQEDHDVSGANPEYGAGSAYMFYNNSGTWGQVQKIVASDRYGTDYFGFSVSISGDYAIVGAFSEDEDANGENSLSGAGSAYMFYRNAGTWVQTEKIVATDRGASDSFGYSVSIDGFTAIVGAYQEDEDAVGGNTLSTAGSAYFFGHEPATIYVNHSASGTNDGSSWTNAYTSLQSALDVPISGDEIWVAKGTYYPSQETDGTTDTQRKYSFQMVDDVEIYGGFAGTESATTERTDYSYGETNETILSGDFNDDDVISGSGATLAITGNSENTYHVFDHPSGYSLSSTAVLDGFTLKGGNANGSSNPYNDAGAMYNQSGQSPTINNCYFIGNRVSDNGGAVFNASSANANITNCTFTLNYATDAGGAIANYDTDAIITNCLFYGNRAKDEKGGGIYNYSASNPVITNCTFIENSSVSGGGVYNTDNSDITIVNSIVYGNTITTGVGTQIRNYTNSNLTLSYSDIEGGISGGIYSSSGGSTTDGGNNIDSDPEFVGSSVNSSHPYSIYGISPCADAGDNSACTETYDIRGSDYGRKLDKDDGTSGTIDIGAYEYKYNVDNYELIVYVDTDASGNNDGSSWTNAYTSFQSALDAASSGDIIWVAAGTYKPSSSYDLTNTSRFYHFRMIEGVEIYGGFSGTEFHLSERTDYDVGGDNETILSGDIGTVDDNSDNCYHVFYHLTSLSLTGTAILDGFTITKANANGSNPHEKGAGMYNYESSPSINNCTFSGSTASNNAGGMYNFLSSPDINNCSFLNNTGSSGGGMYNIFYSSPTITNCTFSENTATVSSGGVYNYQYSSPTITNCIFNGNTASFYGGGMYNRFTSSPEIINCTFTGNSSLDGGGMANYQSSPTITNSIFWGNTATTSGNEINNDASTPAFSYCDIEGSGGSSSWDTGLGTDGGNNIDSDPKFVGSSVNADHPYSIYGSSPCADVGDDDLVNNEDYDIRGLGYDRNLDKSDGSAGIIDMGAYEYKFGTDPLAPDITWDGSGNSDWNTGGNWSGNEVPTATSNIIIPNVTNDPVIATDASASCTNLTIENGATLTLESTASGTGSLIANGTITNNGTITAQRYTTAGVWHGISSPLSGTTANTYYLNGNPDVWLKEHSESTNAYTYLTSLTTPLSEMKGFFIWVEGSTAKTFDYVGNLIQGQSGSDNNLIRSAPGTEQGWNFVGNPFTSAIDWNASSGWTKTNVDGTIYIYNSPNWATWNGTTGTNGGTQYIASGQGFFVNVTDDGSTQGTLKIDDGTKVHNTVGFLKNQERAISELVRLKVSNDTYTDETVIYFEEAATESYDPDFDAHKLFSFNTDAPQIFSTANNNMAINVLPIENTEVPVDVIGVDGDNMIITATEVIGFGDVFILDNYTGIQTNLSNSSYEFMYEENITDRFLVFFTTVSVPENQSKLFKTYSYENNVRVIIPRGTDAEIEIYNLIGQKITQAKAHAGINDIPVYETGYYLVKIMDDNNVVAKKVFIR